MEISDIVNSQREFFKTHKTKDLDYRLSYLKKLRENILKYEKNIFNALYLDLNKCETESMMCETSLCIDDIDYFIKNLKKLAKPKKVKGTLANFPSKSYSVYEPYGVTLIMSPWNYPFLLTIEPLIECISAGNTAILKVGNASKNTSLIIKKIIEETFPPEYVFFLDGDRNVNQKLLSERFDYVFFTGSKEVGKIVLRAQSEFLTPVTLELGGKSPCIIEKTADLKLSAKRIIFGKIINAGQTCVAPDYILIDKSIKDDFIRLFFEEMNNQLPTYLDKDYGKIINEKHFERLISLLTDQKIIYGGHYDQESQKIEPTLIECDIDNIIMKDEIFGPLLPLITYNDENEIFELIDHNPTPLALYYFGNDKKLQKKILSYVRFGGGCINDTIMHLVTNMAFGGTGTSGMGSYHKKYGFYTFSHTKNILEKGKNETSIRYRPFTDKKKEIIKKFLSR